MMRLVLRRVLALVILVVWIAALFFPSIGTCRVGAQQIVTWWDNPVVVLLGWLGTFSYEFGWWANVSLAASFVALAFGKDPKAWTVLIGVVLAISALLPVELWEDEGGVKTGTVCRFGLGFWLWFTACALPLVTLLSSLRREGAPNIGAQ